VNPGTEAAEPAGGCAVLIATNEQGKKVLVVEGISPRGPLENVEAGQLVEALFDYLEQARRTIGAQAVVIPDDSRAFAAQTNNIFVNSHLRKSYGRKPKMPLMPSKETYFNYLEVTYRCVVVRP